MAWISRDYLYPRWVADGWLLKQPLDIGIGAWVSAEYLSNEWAGTSWLHYELGTGLQVNVLNTPSLPIVVFSGSARQTTKVNATTASLAVARFNAIANTEHSTTQVNLPDLNFSSFPATVNAGIYQLGDIVFSIEVDSTITYSKVVTAQNTPAVALAAVDAIVTVGQNVNVAATKAALPLQIFAVNAKANSAAMSTTTAISLQKFNATVNVGKRVTVLNRPAIGLVPIPVSVTGDTSIPTSVTATTASVGIAVFNVAPVSNVTMIRARSTRVVGVRSISSRAIKVVGGN